MVHTMTKKYIKDYTVRVGRVNWNQYKNKEPDPHLDYIIDLHNKKFNFFCKTEEDANYLRIRSPEWIHT